MEVYVLDSLLRRTEVIDRFESLIWTDRRKDIGDFELLVQSTPGNRRRFTTGTRLALTESKSVMTVETVEDITDSEGRKKLKVKGRSLELILDDRVAIGTYAGYTPMLEWSIQNTPEEIARYMFFVICVDGQLHPNDVIPYIVWDQNSYPEDTIPESNFEILHYQKPMSLYKAIKDLADIYDFGFRLYRNGDASQLFFNIYTGSDRTTRQTTLTAVVFSPELGSLMKTNSITTIEKSKNCAYVLAQRKVGDTTEVHRAVVYADNVDPSVEGFERRQIFVDGKITEPTEGMPALTQEEIDAQLIRQGLDELSKHSSFTAFDGEVNQHSQWKYGFHYFLGDLVSMQNSDGFVNHMRVEEQTFVSDGQGDRAYPTLAVNTFIQPGTWESWGFQAWEDVELTEYWDNQP